LDEEPFEVPTPSGKVPARIYRPHGTSGAPGVVLVHGVHQAGIDEVRLVRFARSIASAGVVVMTPLIAELADYRVDPRSIDTIGASAQALREKLGQPTVGMMGVSFGGGLALLTAADPRFDQDIGFVVAVGAHDDLSRVSTFFATNEIAAPDGSMVKMHAHEYGPLVLVYSHIDDFFPRSDVAAAQVALRLWLWEKRDEARAALPALSMPSREKMQRLFDGKVDSIAKEIEDELAKNREAAAAVSPRGHLGGVKVPVFLLHGAGDTVIPPSETLWLAKDLPPGVAHDVLVSTAVIHVDLDREPTLQEKWALVHFMADVLAQADRART
jgi:dienelactone hydrolase